MRTIITMVAAAAVVVGCAALEKIAESSSARLAVKVVALKYIERPRERVEVLERASRVLDVSERARRLVADGVVATIPALEVVVRESIDWSRFDLAETLLIDELITVIRVELESKVADGEIDGDELLAVQDVLAWVGEAARLVQASYQ